MKSSAAILLTAALIALASCSGQAVGPAVPDSGAGTPPALAEIPFPDAVRQASMTQIIPGDSAVDTSATGTSYDAGHTLVIEPTTADYAWAIYGYALPDDQYPTGLSIDIYSLSGEFWLGLADYSRRAWDWRGPFDTGGPLDLQPWTGGTDYVSETRELAWVVAAEQDSRVRISWSVVSSELYTFVESPGIGEIVVRLTPPETPRYTAGAPVVVHVNTWAMEPLGFTVPLTVQQLGMVQLSYLWPGIADEASGLASDGTFDCGGPACLAALRDVIRYAGGLAADTQGRTIDDLLPMDICMDNVGLNTFSNPGIAATNVLAIHGAELPAGLYLIGGENPTNDQILTKELGIWETPGVPSENPFYDYPADFTPACLLLDYTAVGWVEDAQHVPGRPVFAHPTEPNYIMHEVTPEFWGKRYFSSAICHALLTNGVFTEQTWPADVATLAEARAAWPLRSTCGRDPVSGDSWNHYEDIGSDVNVMLVFALEDHMQPAADKPHVHMGYYGFHDLAGCWTRLNPDGCYIEDLFPAYAGFTPDNAANTEPADWIDINDWAFPNELSAKHEVTLAAIAEMADRTQYGAWADDLNAVFP